HLVERPPPALGLRGAGQRLGGRVHEGHAPVLPRGDHGVADAAEGRDEPRHTLPALEVADAVDFVQGAFAILSSTAAPARRSTERSASCRVATTAAVSLASSRPRRTS